VLRQNICAKTVTLYSSYVSYGLSLHNDKDHLTFPL